MCLPTFSRWSSTGCRCRASRRSATGLWPFLRNLILPTVALGLIYIALIARITRATMLEVLSQDYVRTAKAKGVGQRAILFVHALKNAAVPIVTIIGIGVALLIGGAVVTESVFAIPGLGRLTVDAILRRDYPVIQGVVLMFSFVYVLVNLGVDLLYTAVRPEDPVLSASPSSANCRQAAPRCRIVLPPPASSAAGSATFIHRHPDHRRSAALLLGADDPHRDLRALAGHRRSDRAGAGQAHRAAVGAVLVRHRHAGARRLFARDVRRAHFAARRLLGRRRAPPSSARRSGVVAGFVRVLDTVRHAGDGRADVDPAASCWRSR